MGLFLSIATCIWGLRISVVSRNTRTDLESELMVTRGLGSRRAIDRESGIDMYTLLYLKRVTELPWWSTGWESALQCGGRGFDLCSGNRGPTFWGASEPTSHSSRVCSPQLRRLWAETRESMHHNKNPTCPKEDPLCHH